MTAMLSYPDREFRIWIYVPSHSCMLLRSSRESHGGPRVDIAFANVSWINIPIHLNGVIIERPSREQMGKISSALAGLEVRAANIMIVRGESYSGYVAAGGIEVDESNLTYNEPDKWDLYNFGPFGSARPTQPKS